MRLTPQDIHHKEFKRGMRGYNEAEVDFFLDEVYEEFERVYKENHELRDETEKLKDRIERFEKLEKTLNETLISAQQTASEIREKAQQESESILQAANDSVQLKLSEAATKAARLEENLGELIETEKTFREELKRFVLGFANRIDSVSAVVETGIVGSSAATSMDANETDVVPGIENTPDDETFHSDESIVISDIDAPEEILGDHKAEPVADQGIGQAFGQSSDNAQASDKATDIVPGIEASPDDETFHSDESIVISDIDAPEEILGDHKAEPVEVSEPVANVQSGGLFGSEVKDHELLMLTDDDNEPHTLAVIQENKIEAVSNSNSYDPDKTQEFDPSRGHLSSDTYKSANDPTVDSFNSYKQGAQATETKTITNENEGFTIRSGTESFWGKRSDHTEADKNSEINSEETLETKGGVFVSGNMDNFITGEKVVSKTENDDRSDDDRLKDDLRSDDQHLDDQHLDDQPKDDSSRDGRPSGSFFGYGNKTL